MLEYGSVTGSLFWRVDIARAQGVESWLMAAEQDDVHGIDMRLAIGALLTEELRAAILEETGFKCSAGIAHNKVFKKTRLYNVYVANSVCFFSSAVMTYIY